MDRAERRRPKHNSYRWAKGTKSRQSVHQCVATVLGSHRTPVLSSVCLAVWVPLSSGARPCPSVTTSFRRGLVNSPPLPLKYYLNPAVFGPVWDKCTCIGRLCSTKNSFHLKGRHTPRHSHPPDPGSAPSPVRVSLSCEWGSLRVTLLVEARPRVLPGPEPLRLSGTRPLSGDAPRPLCALYGRGRGPREGRGGGGGGVPEWPSFRPSSFGRRPVNSFLRSPHRFPSGSNSRLIPNSCL